MTNLNYNTLLSELLTDHLITILQTAKPGHCLRLEGLSLDVLRTTCLALQEKASSTKTVLLSNHPTEEYEVSATKLIELRNLAEGSHSLLVLIPSNLRTAAEDSFDRTTFKQVEVGSLQHLIIEWLEAKIPANYKSYYDRIITFLKENGTSFNLYNHAEYLLACCPFESSSAQDESLQQAQDGGDKVSWGRNLFLFGLIPDDILLDNPKMLEQRLSQNLTAVEYLRDEREPLIRRIFNFAVKPNNIQKPLFNFLTQQGTPEDVKVWGKLIVERKEYAHLNLKHWQFTDLMDIEELELLVYPLKGKNVVYQEGEKRIITKANKAAKMTVKFETRPSPAQVNELSHFRIDLMRMNEDAEIEKVNTLIKFAKTAGKASTRSKQVTLNPDHIDEGVYFFRVYALDKAGTVLNRNDRFQDKTLQDQWQKRQEELGEGASREDLQGKLSCDSEDFYFVVEKPGEITDVPPESPSPRTKVANLFQAIVKARLDYATSGMSHPDSLKVTEKFWTDKGKGTKRQCDVEVRFNDVRHTYIIPLATSLREISLQILRSADKLGTFRIDFSDSRNEIQRRPYLRDNQLAEAAPGYFLEARKSAFENILEQIRDEETDAGLGIVETCDFESIAEPIETYLAAYQQWIEELLLQAKETMDEVTLRTIKHLQLLDHVELVVPGLSGHREYVLLLTPLHPLRLGWYLQQQRLYLQWEALSLEASETKKLWTDEAQEVFLGGLKPTINPVVIHGRRLRSGNSSFYYTGEVAPGWGLYVPVSTLNLSTETATSRALLNQIQELLGVPAYLREEADFSVKNLYRQIRRYLIQHPYIEVLHINVFNPGSGDKIVECLKLLQQEQNFSHLRYEIRLITSSNRLSEAGSAFDDFLRPSGTISDEADAFIVPTSNPLFPKIRFSQNSISEYQAQPEKYEAHVSIILDMFPVDIKLLRENSLPEERSIFCHGLILDPINQVYKPSEETFGWHHYLALNETPSISDEDVLTDSLTSGLRKLQQLIAITLAGQWTEDIPALSLILRDSNRALIYQIHQQSGWVITIDRNLGIDLFDVPTDPECLPYLLDYKPGSAIGEPPILLTTRPSSEVYGLLKPHLLQYGVLKQDNLSQLAAFLEILRSVSGSVIMQFLSGPTKALETIGIALSRLLLEHLDLLQDHFMIPLDMHQEFFNIKDDESSFSRQRGDFLLISCDPTVETIYMQVVETKCRTSIGGGAVLASLKTKMTEQLEDTITSLQYHFDPSLRIPDRLDRSVKNRQLYRLLDFYLKRAHRYNLISDETFQEYQHVLSKLHAGYTLSFHQIGLIFEFEGDQQEVITDETGAELTFFHVGRKMIEKLLMGLGEPVTIEKKQQEPLTEDLVVMRTTLRKSRRPEVSPPVQVSEIPQPTDYETPRSPEPVAAEQSTAQYGSHASTEDQQEADYEAPQFTDLIGEDHLVPQYGLLASTKSNRKIALDLNGCNTISLFGVPGGGKSYTLGTIVEMATQRIPAINLLPSPLATVIFHYNESQDYPPEFVSMRYKNDSEREIELLRKVYGAEPDNLKDVLLLVPKDKIALRQQEYPDVTIAPIAFSSQELSIKDWKFLMGALGNQAMYMQHLNMIMRRGRDNLTLEFIKEQVEASTLSEAQKMYTQMRLELAAQFIDDSAKLRDLLTPGKLIIVDLREEFIEKDQALGLFVVMLNIFAGARKEEGSTFNKLIVFDEAHKYITHSDLTSHVVREIREMRHKGVTLLIASQDPPSLPNEVIELSSVIILHRFNSPKWLSHIQKSSIALKELTTTQLANLQPGEAFLWANKATNPEWTRKAIKVITRPRVTKHGGSTQKAVV